MIGPHRRKMACRASEGGWEMRIEKTHLDIGRGGAFDEPVDLHDIAVGASARPLDAYSTRGGGVSDCTLNENGIRFARGCGRSGQPSGE